jgi:glycosyltransferase 2 family protein
VPAALAAALVVWRAPLDWADVWSRVRHARPLPYAAAVAVCYLSFGMRAARWRVLLANAGERCAPFPLLGALLASFAVNCVVPARVGDLLRALLVRRHQGVGAAKALGTIVVERVIDLAVVLLLLLAAVGLTLHRPGGGGVAVAAAAAAAVCGAAAGLLVLLRSGCLGRLAGRLPRPLVRACDGFRQGSLGCLGSWRRVLPLSLGIWGVDTTRLALVVAALGGVVGLGPAQLLLVTLVAALLSTTPLLPGGIGAVESGVVLVLTTVAHAGADQALAIVLLDRSITYGSVVVSGAVSLLALQARGARPAYPGWTARPT